MNESPILKSDGVRIEFARQTLIGRHLRSVIYMQALYGGYERGQDGVCHQVDFRLILNTSDISVSFSWERENLIQGLGIGLATQHAASPDEVAVDGGDEWLQFTNDRITELVPTWFSSATGQPKSMWAVRLIFDSGASVVIALGERDANGSPTFHPDSLVVLFDESSARSYVVSADSGNSWGSIVN